MDHMEYGLEFCEKTLIPIIKNVVDKYVGTSYSIEKKGQGNFVTTVDKKIEQELIDRFQQLVPGSGVIAEETEAQLEQKFNWIIDPIDGTTNFINGLQYAVSVALVYEQPDHILLGVVYNPKDDIWYYACKGKGSYILEKGYEMRNENSITAEYYRTPEQEYTVQLGVLEKNAPLIQLKITVPTEEMAKNLCHNWPKRSQEIYASVMTSLS